MQIAFGSSPQRNRRHRFTTAEDAVGRRCILTFVSKVERICMPVCVAPRSINTTQITRRPYLRLQGLVSSAHLHARLCCSPVYQYNPNHPTSLLALARPGIVGRDMGLLPRFPRALQRAMNGQEGCLSTRCNRLEGSPSAPQPNRDAHAPAPEDRIRFPRRSHCLVRLHLRQRVSAPCISWSNPSPSAKATHSRLDASRPGRP